jgi:aldehyde:ferredoxin oxidoreductase
MDGYGKILHVDLSRGRTWTEPAEDYRHLIGGRGLNAGLLFNLLKRGSDPLGPDNVLVFGTGPVAGTIAPSSARYNVSAKSPLTGYFGDSNSGGFWGPELRYAGYNAIVVYGRSPKPVYLMVTDEAVGIIDAEDLWGGDTHQTSARIQRIQGDPAVKVACIGPAGENLVRFACVINDYGRAAGRTGMGAVMGSKNLKAIAVRGRRPVGMAHPVRFNERCRSLVATIKDSRQFELYHQSGVIGHKGIEDYRDDNPANSVLGFKYHTTSVFPGFGKIGGKEWWKTHWTKVKGCAACQMHCSHFYIVREGPFAGIMGEGIDAEAMAFLTSHIGGESKEVAALGYQMLNRLGMDTQEMGANLGALMVMYENGVVTDQTLRRMKGGWLKPRWGDTETILSLIEMTAYRRGIGDLLAEGPYRWAKGLGDEALYWVIHNKKMSVGGGDRRVQKGAILNHMVSNRGPDHLRGSPSLEFYGYTGDRRIEVDWNKYIGDPELFKSAVQLTSYVGKAPLVIWQETLRSLSDSFGVCSFNYGNWPNTFVYPEDFAELYSAITGEEMDAADMIRASERIINLEKAFNVRENWTRDDDQPPERWVRETKPDGVYRGEHCHLDKYNTMLDDYYRRRGWDARSGLPTRPKLESLGLSHVAEELSALGRLA